MRGLIARMDKSGLGVQTHRLARLLKPDKIMLIDSTIFNGNEQHPEWYKDYNTTVIDGFPNQEQIVEFMKGLNTVISCEMFYNNHFTRVSRDLGVKTVLIANPEFFDWFKPQWRFIPPPTKIIVPSKWMIDYMNQFFPTTYLPTPIFEDEFKSVRQTNLECTGRNYLFMNGKTAAEDRNGLEALYRALEKAKGDFTVTVKAQNDVKKHPDPRLIYDFSNPTDQKKLYEGYDLLIQPRRYGGQTLSMCEALSCAIPVVMTAIDPNYHTLPKEWLVPAYKDGELMTRIPLDLYTAEQQPLADLLDNIDLSADAKKTAYNISKQYEAESLRTKYEELLHE